MCSRGKWHILRISVTEGNYSPARLICNVRCIGDVCGELLDVVALQMNLKPNDQQLVLGTYGLPD